MLPLSKRPSRPIQGLPTLGHEPAHTGSPAPLDLASLLGARAWQRLPAAVQRRFTADHADAVYEGRLDLACSAVGRAYARLSALFGGPLTPVRASGVPTTVRVHADGQGGVVWERRFGGKASGRARVVRSTKSAGPAGTVTERTDGGLAMQLAVFEEGGALVFRSERFLLAVGRWRLPIPDWLTPGVCRVEHHDEGAGRFRFTLTMDHPWWGRTFHQTGLFDDPAAAAMTPGVAA